MTNDSKRAPVAVASDDELDKAERWILETGHNACCIPADAAHLRDLTLRMIREVRAFRRSPVAAAAVLPALPPVVREALEFYSDDLERFVTFNPTKRQQQLDYLRGSPDWQEAGEDGRGHEVFRVTTAKAESALDALKRWQEEIVECCTTRVVAAAPVVQEPAAPEPPLLGRWHHGEGNLCSGTLRIARADFDTNPRMEFQAEVFEWIAATLNAALAAHKRGTAAPVADVVPPEAADVARILQSNLGSTRDYSGLSTSEKALWDKCQRVMDGAPPASTALTNEQIDHALAVAHAKTAGTRGSKP